MTGHIPIDVAIELEPMICLLSEMAEDLVDSDPHLCPALNQAVFCLKDAIVRDELGISDWFPPSWADSSTGIHPYVKVAIQNELAALVDAPAEDTRRAIHKTAKSLGRWVGGGLLDPQDGKRALWKVIAGSGMTRRIQKPQAIEVMRSGWRLGLSQPRSLPDQGVQNEERNPAG